MKHFLTTVLLIAICALCASAKADTTATERHGTAQYAMTYDEWRSGKLYDIDGVREEARSNNAKIWSGGGDVKLTTGNKTYDTALKNKVFLVRTDSALYVSMRGMRTDNVGFGKNFVRTWMLPDSTLVFAFIPWGKAEAQKLATSAFFFGIAGGVMQANKQMKAAKALYAITDGSHNAHRLTKNGLHDLLALWPEVQAKVDALSPDSKYDYALVLQCMREGGILKNR